MPNGKCLTCGEYDVDDAHDCKPNMSERIDVGVIGGFKYSHPLCRGCHEPLKEENAWMADGCPCNSPLGVNNENQTRWRLLMQLQQNQSRDLEAARHVHKQTTTVPPPTRDCDWKPEPPCQAMVEVFVKEIRGNDAVVFMGDEYPTLVPLSSIHPMTGRDGGK